jgi:hypothetical protein
MGVKELNPADTSIWQFFAMTVTLLSADYLVFFLQSQYFEAFLFRHRAEIRRFAEFRNEALLGSDDDRNNLGWVIQYLWKEKSTWLANSACIILIFVPILPIWTSSLAHAMKLITSITILLASLMVLLMANYEAIERTLLREMATKKMRKKSNNHEVSCSKQLLYTATSNSLIILVVREAVQEADTN